MGVPLTGLSTLTGVIVMSVAWLVVRQRITASHTTPSRPVALLQKFFVFMFIFFALMGLPHLLLYTNYASSFPMAMAWGYTVGHIFMFIAFTYVTRMIFAILPQLSSKERWATIGGAVVTVVATIITAVTMIGMSQPSYDYSANITNLNAAAPVGAAIAGAALLSLLPAGVLFLFSAFKQSGGHRTKSLLLGLGFVILTVAGPLHDVARNWQSFLIADIFTILGILLIGSGVVYKLNANLALKATPATQVS